MTTQHSAITDPELHEPKGASSATAGKVYVSDGLGSGDWSTLSKFAEQYITGGATTQALTTTAARLDPGTAWTTGINSGVTVTPTDGTFTITEADSYQMSFWASFDTDSVAAGTIYTFYYAVNGVATTRNVTVQKLTAGVDRLTISATGMGSFVENDVISIYAKSSTASTITPREAGFSLHSL